MRIIDGTSLANDIKLQVKKEIEKNVKHCGGEVNFAAVLVGDNPASRIYINRKKKACDEVGINMFVSEMNVNAGQAELNKKISDLSADKNIHAILLQLPLPEGLNAREAISYMDPRKDVDGLTFENFGKLATEQYFLAPCTANAVLYALEQSGIPVAGKDVCVIGRSEIVGKPLSLLLMARDATVTVCHKKTRDLEKHTCSADIVVVAAGCPGLLCGDMIKSGAVVVDVGINRMEDGTIVGDADFVSISGKASAVTPVPGGIGPLTIAFLLNNIVHAWTALSL